MMADEVPAFDDIPSFDDLPDAQGSQPAPQQSAGQVPAFDDIPAFDDLPDQPTDQRSGSVAPETPFVSGVREAAHAIIPTITGLVGAGLGTAGGALTSPVTGPVGPIAGGVGGMVAGSYMGDKLQHAALDAFGINDDVQRAANASENPASSFVGGLVPAVATMSPGKIATSVAQRATGAGMLGGFEGAQEYANEGQLDPEKIAIAAATGAVFPGANKLGEKFMGAGGKLIPGRPNVAANPAADTAHVDVGANQTETAAGDSSTAQQPIVADGNTTGNPQSAPERSDRAYPKDNSTNTPPEGDMLTTGDMDPATLAALKGDESAAVPADQTELGADIGAPQAGPDTASAAQRLTGAASPAPAEVTPAPAPAPAPPEAPNKEAAKEPAKAPEVDAGFPAPGEPLDQGSTNAAPPAAAAAIATSKANSAKPKLGLKEIKGQAEAGAGPPSPPEDPSKEAAKEPAKAPLSTDELLQRLTIPERKVTGRANPTPSDAQKEAGNYQKAHERDFGRAISIETHKGDERSDVGADGKPWTSISPDDYGHFLGTKGADGDPIDVYRGTTGDKNFIVDQRDYNTGKFDEHKVMTGYKDLADARDTYLKGFSDDKAMARLHDITEVSPDELKSFLAGQGKSTKKPYGAPMPKVVTQKAPPKVVTAAVNLMKEQGLHDAADKLMAMEPGPRSVEAAKYVNAKSSKTGVVKSAQVARIRPAAPEVPGAPGITAKSLADAKRKGDALAQMKKAVADNPPDNGEMRPRLEKMVEDAGNSTEVYKPSVKPPEYMLLRRAKEMLQRKTWKQEHVAAFEADEKLARSSNPEDHDLLRKGNRIDADISMSKRSGDEAISKAESAHPFDTPHEEAEDMVEPKAITKASDIKKPTGKTLDMDKPEHRAEIAAIFNKDVETTPKWKELQDAKRKETAENVAKQLAARKAKADPGASAAVRKVELTPEAKAAAMKAMEAAQAKGKGLDALPAEREAPKKGVRDLLGDFVGDESGAGHPGKAFDDLKAALKAGASYLKPHYTDPEAYHSQKLDTPEKKYNSSLSDDFHQLVTQATEHSMAAQKWSEAMGKKYSKPLREKMYFAHEEGKLGTLAPDEKAKYDADFKPMFDRNEAIKQQINKLDPDKMGPDVLNHIRRIAQNGHDPLGQSSLLDPLGGRNNISTRAQGTALERKFQVLERQDGKRFVITPSKNGYILWNKYKATTVKDPNFEFKAGDTMKAGNNTLTMKDATTREIEANARGADKKPMKYYHDAAFSAAMAQSELAEMAHHMQFLHDLKDDPAFKARSTNSRKDAIARGWGGEPSKIAEFKGTYVDPELKKIMDDYAKPGFDESSIDRLRNLSQAITKTIYWNPVVHLANVGAHFFVGRGWENATPSGIKSLVTNGYKAIKSVHDQDRIQTEIRNAGGSTMYGNVLTSDNLKQIGKSLGHDVKTNPAKWDPIAKKFGIGPSTLTDAIYRASSKVMWAGNDMMYTQLYLDHRAKGLSPEGAVKATEKDIPNYRLPPNILGSRGLSKIMSDQAVTAFGRYHYGIWNAYANTVHAAIGDHGSTGTEKIDAIGKMVMMGVLAFAIKPLLDKVAQKVTGNEHASMVPRGPLTVPFAAARAVQGKTDPMEALRDTLTMAPLPAAGLQVVRNKDFADRNIIEPGDFSKAAHGSPRAAAKVAGQAGEFAARNAIAPLNLIENEEKKPNGGILPGLRDQLLGIKNPSPKASKYEAVAPRKANSAAMTRERQGGRGIIEGAIDRLTK
jgi:hypothetical protein